MGFSRFDHSLQGSCSPLRVGSDKDPGGPFPPRNQKRMFRRCVFLSPDISVFRSKSGVFLTLAAPPLARHPWTPVLASLMKKRALRSLLCFSHAVLFSAPHQGCKPPTPADLLSLTPRAGGRVLGKNRLAQDAEKQ